MDLAAKNSYLVDFVPGHFKWKEVIIKKNFPLYQAPPTEEDLLIFADKVSDMLTDEYNIYMQAQSPFEWQEDLWWSDSDTDSRIEICCQCHFVKIEIE